MIVTARKRNGLIFICQTQTNHWPHISTWVNVQPLLLFYRFLLRTHCFLVRCSEDTCFSCMQHHFIHSLRWLHSHLVLSYTLFFFYQWGNTVWTLKKYFAANFPTRYTFYDGPPFATGLPHYGHILAGTIKDIVTRFAHQSGFHVDRRFGWDCHGLPVVRMCDYENF